MEHGRQILFGLVTLSCLAAVLGQEEKKSSYASVVPREDFSTTMSRMKTEKPGVMKRQRDLLQERYDFRFTTGLERALKSVEDFTEFEQRGAYFDGDPVIATKKGANVLERGSQVHFMAEFEELLDFPPAPKLDLFGKLNPQKASAAERRGQDLFFGKAQCAVCHAPPYYTDNSMHNLQAERFFKTRMINGRKASADGPVKTFPLRGIKDSPPYLHDGRLLTLEDAVEFFNLILETKLSAEEKGDLVVFLRVL